jgi:hypothetical protein
MKPEQSLRTEISSLCMADFPASVRPSTGLLPTFLRTREGILVEHWDVIQVEATEEQPESKAPMFGGAFPT